MTKENKKRLNELYFENQKKKYPSFPPAYIPEPKYTEKGANALTKCVIDWINFSGAQAERISTTGRPIDNTEISTDVIGRQRTIGSVTWIPGTGTKGSADISASIKPKTEEGNLNSAWAVSVKIEIKYGKDKQSDHQKKYEDQVTQAGGIYLIVRNFDEFVEWWDSFTGSDG